MVDLSAKLVRKHSEKKNKDYYVLEVPITDEYTKVIFLENAETALIKALYNNK